MNNLLLKLSGMLDLPAVLAADVNAIELTTEGLVVVGVVVVAIVIAAFFAGKAASGAGNSESDDETTQSATGGAVSGTKTQSDTELVAVITAAIMAMRDEEAKREGKESVGFRVVSFKRTDRR